MHWRTVTYGSAQVGIQPGPKAAGGEARCIVCGLPFDSQPVYSPDGKDLAFISDRDGNENLWVAQADGSDPRQISKLEDNSEFVSPEWASDGRSIYVTHYKPDVNAFSLWRYSADGANHEPLEEVTHPKQTSSSPKEFNDNAMGAAVSPDGRYLYYEDKTGLGYDDDVDFPLWHIVRRDLKTGAEQPFIAAQGSAFRPRVSPDGKLLVYAERYQGKTELRVRNLETDADRMLAYPVQRDDQEGLATRDLMPRYAFTPDSKSLLTNFGGKIVRIDVTSGRQSDVPFVAHVKLPVGPYMRPELKQEPRPVRARLMQTPSQSPDGKRLVFSALAKVYVATIGADGKAGVPVRLTSGMLPEFEPAWSPDGKWIVYVTWTPESGGEVWRARGDGSGKSQKITDHEDYYAYPVFAPDGKSVFVLRAVEYDQVHKAADFPPYQASLIEIPLQPTGGGAAKVIASGLLRSGAQFTGEAGVLYLNFADGLYRVPLDGGKPRRVLHIVGPAYYFMEGRAPADGVKISPDGQWALAQITQQLYLIRIPGGVANASKELEAELAKASPLETRLTSVGADFFDWAEGGKTITWTLGSTFFREKLADVGGSYQPPPGTDLERAGVEHISVTVEVPRDVPHGAIVLRGATAITMQRNPAGGDGVIADADVVVVDNHIAAVGKRGSVPVPPGAKILDEAGKFIVPGFIDVHIHWGSIRRGILDPECWEFQAALAYGITATLDPSSLSIDLFAYQDMLNAGMMTGSRVFTTGPALFSFNHIETEEEALDDIRRNSDFYRTHNLKEYRTGNRGQRELVAEASRTLGMLTTTEGAMNMKLDMTQIQDGFSGNEHAYSAVPIADDIVQLFAKTGVSYTPTLQISNGGMWGQDYFFSHESPYFDSKLRRFVPHFVLAKKMERLHWGLPQEFSFPLIAAGAARIQRQGGLVAVGSHGELPGMGYQFEMQALAMGGMTPQEVLWAATMGSAKTIGRDSELGSLTAGKYADMVVLDKDPTRDIHNALAIVSVMKNGRLYDGQTLNEVWPRQQVQPATWWQRDESVQTGAAGAR